MKNKWKKSIEKLDISSLTREKLAGTIDHAMLRAYLTEKDIEEGCRLASKYRVATVCVKPCHVALCARVLKDSVVKIAAVVGFPLGGNIPFIKATEAKRAVEEGAKELDMVLNIGALKDGNYSYVLEEIQQVVEKSEGALVKVIVENCFLEEKEKIKACKLAEEAGAHYVKTSTGFGSGGATIEDVKLMYETVAPRLGVKAAGGIHSLSKALAMIEAGATRLGTSATRTIMEEWDSQNR